MPSNACSAETLLSPYLTSFSTAAPVYAAFFARPVSNPAGQTQLSHPGYCHIRDPPEYARRLADVGDACSNEAQTLYNEVLRVLDVDPSFERGESIWPPKDA